MENKMKTEFFLVLVAVIIVFIIFLFAQITLNKKIEKESTQNIILENKTIDFNSLTLRQKIAQMIIVRGDKEDIRFTNLNIGGIFLDQQESEQEYKEKIEKYQEKSNIKLFVSTDLEGAWNAFARNISENHNFPKFSEISTKEQAYKIGIEHGLLLKKLGFNLNFAPVAEYKDLSYGGRAFNGTQKEVKEKLEQYILGLQKNVMGTCKHYPGKGMIKNTHLRRDKQNITQQDLDLFEICFKKNISAVMVGHQEVIGEINSKGKPSSVSKEIISNIDFPGLIISDEINMFGLRSWYLNKNKL